MSENPIVAPGDPYGHLKSLDDAKKFFEECILKYPLKVMDRTLFALLCFKDQSPIPDVTKDLLQDFKSVLNCTRANINFARDAIESSGFFKNHIAEEDVEGFLTHCRVVAMVIPDKSKYSWNIPERYKVYHRKLLNRFARARQELVEKISAELQRKQGYVTEDGYEAAKKYFEEIESAPKKHPDLILGSGGNSTVVKFKDPSDGCVVALKKLDFAAKVDGLQLTGSKLIKAVMKQAENLRRAVSNLTELLANIDLENKPNVTRLLRFSKIYVKADTAVAFATSRVLKYSIAQIFDDWSDYVELRAARMAHLNREQRNQQMTELLHLNQASYFASIRGAYEGVAQLEDIGRNHKDFKSNNALGDDTGGSFLFDFGYLGELRTPESPVSQYGVDVDFAPNTLEIDAAQAFEDYHCTFGPIIKKFRLDDPVTALFKRWAKEMEKRQPDPEKPASSANVVSVQKDSFITMHTILKEISIWNGDFFASLDPSLPKGELLNSDQCVGLYNKAIELYNSTVLPEVQKKRAEEQREAEKKAAAKSAKRGGMPMASPPETPRSPRSPFESLPAAPSSPGGPRASRRTRQAPSRLADLVHGNDDDDVGYVSTSSNASSW